jgi:hypothetical protein
MEFEICRIELIEKESCAYMCVFTYLYRVVPVFSTFDMISRRRILNRTVLLKNEILYWKVR